MFALHFAFNYLDGKFYVNVIFRIRITIAIDQMQVLLGYILK